MFPHLILDQRVELREFNFHCTLNKQFFFMCLTVVVMVCIFISDIGFEVPDSFLVGYALDYNEYFRDLSVSLLV